MRHSWTIPRLWNGGECWIIGGGLSMPLQFGIPDEVIKKVMSGEWLPSAYSPYLSAIHNKHVIGVNNAYMIGHWIDVCFFGDSGWHLVHQQKLAEWPGLKLTCCIKFAGRENNGENIKYLAKQRDEKGSLIKSGISTDPSTVVWNENSGAAAISVAVHFGVKRIILLGFDMNIALSHKQGITHWFGSHHKSRKPHERPIPPFGRHMRGFPMIAKQAKALGIEILNACPTSSIEQFKKVTVNEILGNTESVQI